MRIDSRRNCDHLRFLEFVGTLPFKVGIANVRMILLPLLLANAPLSAQSKIEYGKSLRSGQPKIELDANRVMCSLDRMILIADLVRDLGMAEKTNGTDTLHWTQLRRVLYEKDTDDEIEVSPE